MSSESSQQQLVLIISRYNLNPSVIPPFKIIFPTLQLISPLRLFTTMNQQITINNQGSVFNSLYQALTYHLQNQEGQVSLNDTLNKIYNEKINQEHENRNKNDYRINPWKFRICILGEEVISWDVVMKFKLKNIVIDTIGQTKRLKQISFSTGGINKSPVIHQNIIKLFMTIFSMSTQCRKKFNFLTFHKDEQNSSQTIQFTVDCVCCKPESKELSNECYLCSKCLGVHCSDLSETCYKCGQKLQNMEISKRPC